MKKERVAITILLVTQSLFLPSLLALERAPCEVFESSSRTLKVRSSGGDVYALQKILNTNQLTRISESGLGSPGKETSLFGASTLSSVKKFQDFYRDDIYGLRSSQKSTGIVGLQTKRKLLDVLCPKSLSNIPKETSYPLPQKPVETEKKVSVLTGALPEKSPTPIDRTKNIQAETIAPPTSSDVPKNFFSDGTPFFSRKGYFIDSEKGDNSNPGTKEKPWKTLAKAQTVTYEPGDAILLSCTGSWEEGITLSSREVPRGGLLLSGYGNCTNSQPRLLGGPLLQTFENDPSNPAIYSSTVDSSVKQVFANKTKLIEARYPNYGGPGNEYRIASGIPSQSAISFNQEDSRLLSGKDLIGAFISVRIEPWIVDTKQITTFDASSNQSIAGLSQPFSFQAEQGNGYVLHGKKWMLDSAGEWYYDSQAKKLFLIPPTSEPLTQAAIRVSTKEVGILLDGIKDVRIENINVENFYRDEIFVKNSSNISLKNVSVKGSLNSGVAVESSSFVTIDKSNFQDLDTHGFTSSGENSNLTIRNSRFTKIGLSGNPRNTLSAISIGGANSLVEGNTIENTAYNGITFANKNGTVIKNNLLLNICQRLTDCGGIYTYNGNGGTAHPEVRTKVEKNAIVTARQNHEGTAGQVSPTAGVYMDNNTSAVDVISNMISETSRGILLNEARSILVRDNTTWKTPEAALFVGGQNGTIQDNTILQNTFFAATYLTRENNLLTKKMNPAEIWQPGTTKAVTFGAHKNSSLENIVVSTNGAETPFWTFASPLETLSYDRNNWGVLSKDTLANPKVLPKIIINRSEPSLILDSSFSNSSSSWRGYFTEGSSGSLAIGAYKTCGSTCAKFVSGSSGDFLLSNKFTLSNAAETLYNILVKYTGKEDIEGSLVVRNAESPYQSLGFTTNFSKRGSGEETIDELFSATSNTTEARLDIYGKNGNDLYITYAKITPITSYTLTNPYDYTAHIINPSSEVKNLTCAETKLLNCGSVYDMRGNRLSWPIPLAPWSSKIIVTD